MTAITRFSATRFSATRFSAAWFSASRFSASRFSATALAALVLIPTGCSELPPGVLASREEAIRTAAAELPPVEPERLPLLEARPLDANSSQPSFWVDMRDAVDADFGEPAATNTDQPSDPLNDLSTREIAQEILEGMNPDSPDRTERPGRVEVHFGAPRDSSAPSANRLDESIEPFSAGDNPDFVNPSSVPVGSFNPPWPNDPSDIQRPGRDSVPFDDFGTRQPAREEKPRRTGVPGTVLADQVADRVSKQLAAEVIDQVGNLVVSEMTDKLREVTNEQAEERLEYQRTIDELERELAEAEEQLEETRERLGEMERQRIELEVRLGSREEMIEMLQKLLHDQ